MKPILKVLTSPFRSSKSKKSKKQQNFEDNFQNQAPGDSVENNPGQYKQKVQNTEDKKIKSIYNQVEKMVDQLGQMLDFKQKMTEKERNQLIAELSQIALKEKKISNQLMDEDVIECDESSQGQNQEQRPKQTNEDALTRADSSEKSPDSPNIQESPEKQLHDMFENFEMQNVNPYISEKSQTIQSKKKQSIQSFADVKSQMSKFFTKNSSKILKLMKPSSKSKKSSYSEKQIQCQKFEKKKKGFKIGSMFSSWNSKKEEKTLNSTCPMQNGGSFDDHKQDNGKTNNIDWQNSRLGFNGVN